MGLGSKAAGCCGGVLPPPLRRAASFLEAGLPRGSHHFPATRRALRACKNRATREPRPAYGANLSRHEMAASLSPVARTARLSADSSCRLITCGVMTSEAPKQARTSTGMSSAGRIPITTCNAKPPSVVSAVRPSRRAQLSGACHPATACAKPNSISLGESMVSNQRETTRCLDQQRLGSWCDQPGVSSTQTISSLSPPPRFMTLASARAAPSKCGKRLSRRGWRRECRRRSRTMRSPTAQPQSTNTAGRMREPRGVRLCAMAPPATARASDHTSQTSHSSRWLGSINHPSNVSSSLRSVCMALTLPGFAFPSNATALR